MLIIPPPIFRNGRRRPKSQATVAPPAPINRIASVTMQPDGVTLDIFFTPGTVVTAVGDFDNDFFVNYPGGQTSGNFPSIVSPTHVRIALSDEIESPSTWEVDDPAVFSFASGTFAGPIAGDVVFV